MVNETKLPEGMAALSDFQRRKIEHLYDLFYDVNKDGKIDWEDFKCTVDKVSVINKWADDSVKKINALESLQLVWYGLKKVGDKDSDNSVSREEWYQLWATCAEGILTSQQFPYWLSAYMTFMFEAADTSGDEIIDATEYRTIYTKFGLSIEDCDKSYNKFTEGGTKLLDRELYSKLWHEFFLSDDKDAKGNYLFGCSFM